MRTLIQKVHLENQQSFACREYRTPAFETNWHKHDEYELILITKGNGTLLMGDYVGEYKEGDVYFLAGNLPHWFRKQHAKMISCAIVVHFRKEIFGDKFLAMPELKNISNLLTKTNGIQLQDNLKTKIETLINTFDSRQSFSKVQQLLSCLHEISISKQYVIHTSNFTNTEEQINPGIEIIFDYSFKNYLHPITLNQIAEVANMSIPTFCRFFKKNIKKTYFDFLQELRIAHACKLLTSTNMPVIEICYESGFNSWAHFSKKFKELKKFTPSKYRTEFSKMD
ncbi:MAG: AraC family transcriptional regulator [Lacibacter sp.]